MATRWGICSCGMISNDFCAALRTLSHLEHDVVATAARKKADAEEFAKIFDIPVAYGSYEELAKDPTVEIVYVGTIHPHHYSACKLFLENGKHVLCEKPVTMKLQDLKELIAVAEERKLFFMEGFWTRFFPAIRTLREELAVGSAGKVNILRASFCAPSARMERLVRKDLGGGGLMDIGCYTVQLANLVFREQPDRIVAVGSLNEEGVDVGAGIILTYSGGRMALLYYHTECVMNGNTATIHGTNGNIELHSSFHCPTKITIPSGETKEFPLPDCSYKLNYHNSVGLVYEAQAVRECLQKGLIECPQMTHQDSVNIMTIMEEALRQIGVQYKPA